jgi:hypothetical protein
MKILVLCATVLFLNGCIHLAVVSFIKDTATWDYYNKRIEKIEKKTQ